MFPLDFLKTIGQGIGNGVKKIVPGNNPAMARTPGFVPDGAAKAGGMLPSIARPEAMMPLKTPDVGGRGMLPISPTPFAVEQSNAPITPLLPRPTPPAMPAPTQGIIPTAPQMPGQMPTRAEVAPQMDMDRRNVMLPALPGERGPKEYSRMEAARYDHHRERMKQPGDEGYDGTGQYERRGKDIFRNLAMGFFQGAASNPRNPLAAGLGGALVGGGGTAISPGAGAEYDFNMRGRPQMEQRIADEDAELSRRNAMQSVELQQILNAQRSRQLDADVELKRAQAEKARRVDPKFHNVAADTTVLDESGKQIFRAGPATPRLPAPAWKQGIGPDGKPGYFNMNDPANAGKVRPIEKDPKPMSRAESLDEVYADDGSLEQITEDSLAGRQSMLLEKLTPQERAYISKPPTDQDIAARLSPTQVAILSGTDNKATDAEVTQAYAAFDRLKQTAANEMAQARDKWEKLQNDERARIRRETEAKARVKATDRRTGRAPAAQASPSAPAKKGAVGPEYVNFVAGKLGISPEEAQRRMEADGYTVRR